MIDLFGVGVACGVIDLFGVGVACGVEKFSLTGRKFMCTCVWQ